MMRKGGGSMRICVNEDSKMIQFWVTEDERETEGFMDDVRRASAALSDCDKFKKIVYVSGSQPLPALTYDIIKRNKTIRQSGAMER